MTVMHKIHGSEILSSQEMKKFEGINFLKKKSYTFMLKAGYQVFSFIRANFSTKQPIIVLCGPGNNGGDGFVLAKHIIANGYQAEVYTLTNEINYKSDASLALKELPIKIKNIKFFKIKKKALIVGYHFGVKPA